MQRRNVAIDHTFRDATAERCNIAEGGFEPPTSGYLTIAVMQRRNVALDHTFRDATAERCNAMSPASTPDCSTPLL